MKYVTLLISIFSYFIINAQIDNSTGEEESEDSIVYIVKDPHYVRKTVHLRADPIKTLAVEIHAGPSVYYSYFDVCADCQGIFDSTQQAISIKRGYRSGLALTHFGKKRSSQQVYVDYQQYQEHFSYQTFTDTISINSTQIIEYVNIGLDYGIKFIKSKRFSSILCASVEWQKNIGVSGSTFSDDHEYRILKLSETRKFRENMIVIGSGLRNYLDVTKRAGLSLSLLYRFETLANTEKSSAYIEQKNTFYGLLGAVFYLN